MESISGLTPHTISSSPTLQLILYFSTFLYFFLFPVLAYGAAVKDRIWYFQVTSAIIIICEPVRIWLGYRGNLGQGISETLAFLTCGIFPIIPAAFILMTGGAELIGGEWAVLILLVIFTFLGCILSIKLTSSILAKRKSVTL